MKKSNDLEKQKKIAKERIEILFEKATDVFTTNTERADRYIDIARRIAMKSNLRLSREQQKHFCKHCYSFLKSGVNSTTRIRQGRIITYCKVCKKYTRIPIKK